MHTECTRLAANEAVATQSRQSIIARGGTDRSATLPMPRVGDVPPKNSVGVAVAGFGPPARAA